MEEDLRSLPLCLGTRNRFIDSGMCLVRHVLFTPVSDIADRLKLPLKECEDMVHQVRLAAAKAYPTSAMHLLIDLLNSRGIASMSEAVDKVLCGGFPLCKVVELSGPPGIGKTQICMQLCCSVQIPSVLGGFQGAAVYVDTESSYSVTRQAQMASGLLLHCKRLASRRLRTESTALAEQDKDALQQVENLTMENLLSNIYYFHCIDTIQLSTFIHHSLESFIRSHPHIRLILIDSIAAHYRHDFENYAVRNKLLSDFVQSLKHLAETYKLAVVITNQMTTRFTANGEAYKTPALGDSWGHVCNVRLLLEKVNQNRCLRILKHPALPLLSASFQVCSLGIRDA